MYSRRTKEHCRNTVAAAEVGSRPRLSAAVMMRLRPQGYGPRRMVPSQDGNRGCYRSHGRGRDCGDGRSGGVVVVVVRVSHDRGGCHGRGRGRGRRRGNDRGRGDGRGPGHGCVVACVQTKKRKVSLSSLASVLPHLQLPSFACFSFKVPVETSEITIHDVMEDVTLILDCHGGPMR